MTSESGNCLKTSMSISILWWLVVTVNKKAVGKQGNDDIFVRIVILVSLY